MDAARFERLTLLFSTGSSRRLLSRLAVSMLGVGAVSLSPDLTTAKKNKKKLKRNAFGCVNVGGKCRGKDKNCCSGICQGKKPKKGKKDNSKCKAHDESTCLPDQRPEGCGGFNVLCTTSTGTPGICAATTGNAGYCYTAAVCFPCQKDADCIGECGPQAACIPCAAECTLEGGTACVGLSVGSCVNAASLG
jgi:hypothetical protein